MIPREHFGSEPPGPGWRYEGDGRWVEMDPDSESPVSRKKGPRIAIVGGGPAGLFTAYILNQRFPDAQLFIFEASDCLGGKICTDSFDDGSAFESGVAELYEYLGGSGKDPLRLLIEKDLGLPTTNMSGGGVYLRGKVTRNPEEIEKVFSKSTRDKIEKFHKRMVELMPLKKFAHRWQPDNSHPWANKTFHDAIREEMGDDPVAIHYVETAVHSDLATEPWTCNGLNGIKNVLLDNEEYMQLYHVRGGIDCVVDELTKEIEVEFCMGCCVCQIDTGTHSYTVHYREDGRTREATFEAVIVALPNHWLGQICFEKPSLQKAIHSVLAHYDLPAHYLRVSLLFDKPFWEGLEMPGDFWMMDMFHGCCCYDESYRWHSQKGHVLSFLLAGQDALLQCSANQTEDEVVDCLIDSLPDELRDPARQNLLDAQVDQFVGSINAQPGGWPVEELRGEHHPDPQGSPGFFLVSDYFFDSTLNACLISAYTAVDLLLEHFDVESAKPTSAAVRELAKSGIELGLSHG